MATEKFRGDLRRSRRTDLPDRGPGEKGYLTQARVFYDAHWAVSRAWFYVAGRFDAVAVESAVVRAAFSGWKGKRCRTRRRPGPGPSALCTSSTSPARCRPP